MSEYKRPEPQPGETWRHYKGGRYLIVNIGKMEADLEPVVIYWSGTDGQTWVRPLDNFMAEMVGLGPGPVYRFERV